MRHRCIAMLDFCDALVHVARLDLTSSDAFASNKEKL